MGRGEDWQGLYCDRRPQQLVVGLSYAWREVLVIFLIDKITSNIRHIKKSKNVVFMVSISSQSKCHIKPFKLNRGKGHEKAGLFLTMFSNS